MNLRLRYEVNLACEKIEKTYRLINLGDSKFHKDLNNPKTPTKSTLGIMDKELEYLIKKYIEVDPKLERTVCSLVSRNLRMRCIEFDTVMSGIGHKTPCFKYVNKYMECLGEPKPTSTNWFRELFPKTYTDYILGSTVSLPEAPDSNIGFQLSRTLKAFVTQFRATYVEFLNITGSDEVLEVNNETGEVIIDFETVMMTCRKVIARTVMNKYDQIEIEAMSEIIANAVQRDENIPLDCIEDSNLKHMMVIATIESIINEEYDIETEIYGMALDSAEEENRPIDSDSMSYIGFLVDKYSKMHDKIKDVIEKVEQEDVLLILNHVIDYVYSSETLESDEVADVIDSFNSSIDELVRVKEYLDKKFRRII